MVVRLIYIYQHNGVGARYIWISSYDEIITLIIILKFKFNLYSKQNTRSYYYKHHLKGWLKAVYCCHGEISRWKIGIIGSTWKEKTAFTCIETKYQEYTFNLNSHRNTHRSACMYSRQKYLERDNIKEILSKHRRLCFKGDIFSFSSFLRGQMINLWWTDLYIM